MQLHVWKKQVTKLRAQIDVMHIDAEPGNDTVPYGMDLSEYYINIEWDILDVKAVRNVKKYPCCPEPYPDIHFYIKVRRKPLYFIVNLILPCLGIFYLTILVFYLPAQVRNCIQYLSENA